ncbi:MAG: arylsulfatase family protein [Verrucomicrobiales bacterium]|nr:arylsulfatase family protein [Verrucomicrobiales bacterium]
MNFDSGFSCAASPEAVDAAVVGASSHPPVDRSVFGRPDDATNDRKFSSTRLHPHNPPQSMKTILGILTFSVSIGLTLPAFAATAGKPNILLIVADDLGYGELTAQGFTTEIPTPNIDSIAKNGTRFTSGYVTGPYCSPTRAALLTGRYQQRFGHEFNPGPPREEGAPIGLSVKEKTLADRLKPAGYATAWIGKSHLGIEPQFHPMKRGFDEFYGFLGGAHSYTQTGDGANVILRGTTPVESVGYTTEAFAKETVDFIDRHRQDPWFVYLAFNAVHAPLDTLKKYEDRFTGITDPKRRKFAALLSALDDATGSVLTKVRETNQEENTLIIFHSDNGGPTPSITSGNGPLRGYKAQTWEGGVRVPFFAQWKGTLPAGKVDDRPVAQIDVLPTALAAAGVPVDPEWKVDGVNLLPYLKGENAGAPHEAIFWRFGQQIAVRKGDWKLVKAESGSSGKASTAGAGLYNLSNDIGEKTDVAAANPDKVSELAALWNQWNSGLVDPAWTSNRAGKNAGAKRAPAAPSATPADASATGPWKSGDVVASAVSPRISGRGFEVRATVEATAENGVIVAQGGGTHGFALHLKAGKPVFSLRSAKVLTSVEAAEKLPAGKHVLTVRLAADGQVNFVVDGQPTGSGKVPALLTAQPGEGLSVGGDGTNAVGDYKAPNRLPGLIDGVTVTSK